MESYCRACAVRREYSAAWRRLGVAAAPLYGRREPTTTARMTPSAEDIVGFWFGEPPADQPAVDALLKRWFGSSAQLDAQIRDRFLPTMAAAASSRLVAWRDTPRGRLALILLLDQFPRNVFRSTAAAFAQDAKALDLTTSGIAIGMDRHLGPLQRLFFYMPMQHSEAIAVQDRSVALFETLAESDAPKFLTGALRSSAEHARQHRDIIAAYGRFPHRNALLGRDSTEAEKRYLEQGGATFGQQGQPERPSSTGNAGDELNA